MSLPAEAIDRARQADIPETALSATAARSASRSGGSIAR